MRAATGWVVLIIFIAALVGGFFVLKDVTSSASSDFSLATTTSTSANNVNYADRISPISDRQVAKGYKEYKNHDYHFSVHYPGDLPAQESHDRGHTLTVVFQKEIGEEAFQIYVAPIRGNQITQERFLIDEPSGVRKDQIETSVDGAEALAFHGFDAAMGQTYEVWFIKGDLLYEVSTYKELEPWLNEILSTWRFI
jgi:hypothetical protein